MFWGIPRAETFAPFSFTPRNKNEHASSKRKGRGERDFDIFFSSRSWELEVPAKKLFSRDENFFHFINSP